ncbi:hypothetical protein KL936_003316 [Ogataea polymorpha]|nr:hypothetical protein KL936_003316 [Ogataea polymorpha]
MVSPVRTLAYSLSFEGQYLNEEAVRYISFLQDSISLQTYCPSELIDCSESKVCRALSLKVGLEYSRDTKLTRPKPATPSLYSCVKHCGLRSPTTLICSTSLTGSELWRTRLPSRTRITSICSSFSERQKSYLWRMVANTSGALSLMLWCRCVSALTDLATRADFPTWVVTLSLGMAARPTSSKASFLTLLRTR